MAGVAGRYASALFELARDAQAIESVEQDLAAVAQLIEQRADFQRFLRSPVISAADQERAVAAVLQKLGTGPLAGNVVRLMARNRRLFVVPDMIRAYRSLAATHRGEVSASVTSATPLTDDQVAALTDTLKVATGRDVKLVRSVDPSLLGGLVVKVGSRMLDSSIRTRLAALRTALTSGA
jgi:F-type H+-transporting ATPase subunit delta